MIICICQWNLIAIVDSIWSAYSGISSVQLLSNVRLFVIPWNAACQASLSFTISQSLLKFMYTELMMHPTMSLSVAPFSSCPQSFPASGSFLMSWLFASSGQSIGVAALATVLPMNIQGWFPLGLTGLIFLLSKGLSRVFSNTTIWKHPFFGTQPTLWSQLSHLYLTTEKNHCLYYMDLCQQSDISGLVCHSFSSKELNVF